MERRSLRKSEIQTFITQLIIHPMCFAQVRHYATQHKKFTLLCFVVLVISTFLTALVYWNTTQREQFVREADGTQAAIHHIMISTDHLVPDALSIHVGEYVQFNTIDSRTHQIGLGGGKEYGDDHTHLDPEFESAVFGAGDAYRVKFSTPGVYDFHDHLHPELFATVIVS